MRATARRSNGDFRHELEVRGFRFTSDVLKSEGGGGEGPTAEELLAASLASCTAVIMEMYAKRKGWDIGEVTVEVDYRPAQRGSPTRCAMVVRLPGNLPDEWCKRLMQVATKSPVHRTLEGEIMFEERLELSSAPFAAPPGGAGAELPSGEVQGRQPGRRPLQAIRGRLS